jgi:tetratricopeptide (TPR) repeat protein
MRRTELTFSFIFIFLAGLLVLAAWNGSKAEAEPGSNRPAYSSNGSLLLPANYRDWIFLTSGFGMNYSTGPVANPMFTNVYVSPEAYQGFKATGQWPDKSMLIVEIYSPAGHGSINKAGHYQDTFAGLDVEVKDSSRPNQWSYYNFNPGATSAAALGGGACNKCHSDNAAVEHTFVQFYPTLLDFALEKGLVKPTVSIPLNRSRFLKLLSNAGWEKAEQAYHEDRKKNPDSDLLNERALNLAGYSLLRDSKTDGAISVFKLVTTDYPNSTNAYDSLGDAYAAAGQAEQAIATSQKELALAHSDSSLSADQKKQFTELAQKRIAAMNKH